MIKLPRFLNSSPKPELSPAEFARMTKVLHTWVQNPNHCFDAKRGGMVPYTAKGPKGESLRPLHAHTKVAGDQLTVIVNDKKTTRHTLKDDARGLELIKRYLRNHRGDYALGAVDRALVSLDKLGCQKDGFGAADLQWALLPVSNAPERAQTRQQAREIKDLARRIRQPREQRRFMLPADGSQSVQRRAEQQFRAAQDAVVDAAKSFRKLAVPKRGKHAPGSPELKSAQDLGEKLRQALQMPGLTLKNLYMELLHKPVKELNDLFNQLQDLLAQGQDGLYTEKQLAELAQCSQKFVDRLAQALEQWAAAAQVLEAEVGHGVTAPMQNVLSTFAKTLTDYAKAHMQAGGVTMEMLANVLQANHFAKSRQDELRRANASASDSR